jgi:hypothetical protein
MINSNVVDAIKKEERKAYKVRWSRSKRGKDAIKRYNNSDKAKACRKKYLDSPKGKAFIKVWKKNYRAMLRERVIDLYTNGEMTCRHCGSEIEELHHSNLKAGRLEKKKYGAKSSIQARLIQVRKHKRNPTYIIPLCKKCHRLEHLRINLEKKLK